MRDKLFEDDRVNKKINHKIKVHITLSGRVQGVAFRYNAKIMADKLGVKGWIKNLPGGEVEAIIEGNRDMVTQMIEWCKKGPRMAIVEDIKIGWLSYTGEFKRFTVY